MWKILAQCRRIPRGTHVGTEQVTVKRKFITGSERIKTDTVKLVADAEAMSAIMGLDRLTRR